MHSDMNRTLVTESVLWAKLITVLADHLDSSKTVSRAEHATVTSRHAVNGVLPPIENPKSRHAVESEQSQPVTA